MKILMLKLILISAFVFVLSSRAMAFEGQEGKHCDWKNATEEQKAEWKAKKEERHGKMMEELGLSEEQKAAMDAIKTKHKEQRGSKKGQMKESRRVLKDLLDDPNSSTADIQAAATKLKEEQNKAVDARIAHTLEIKKILSPEQYHKMKDMREQRKGGKGSKHERKGSAHN